MDAFMLALQPIFDIRTVGKLCLTLTIWLWLAGWHLLGFAIHGRPTWFALGGALVAYHSMFFYGFTNFSFSLGVFLVALAAWLHGRSHWGWPRHLLVAALALACFFAHLSAFIFLAGSVLAVTAWESFRSGRVSRAALVDLVPICVPLVFVRGGGQSEIAWNFPAKLVGAVTMLRGYDVYLDGALIAAVAVFILLLFLWASRVRAVGSTLFVGLGCIGMFFVGPYILFGGAPADARFLLPAAALTFLSLDLGMFVALVVFRMGVIGYYWNRIDADLTEQVALLKEIPDGAKVYPIVKIAETPNKRKRELPSFHIVCYAVIDRHAYVPSLLAIPGHIPMRYKALPILFHPDADNFVPLAAVAWDQVWPEYEYLWGCRLPDDYREFLGQHCVLIGEKGGATLWRVVKSLK
jgi:hypothetical protein